MSPPDQGDRSDELHCRETIPFPSSSGSFSSDFPESEKLRRILIASAKGFAIGAGLKGGLALIPILSRLKRRSLRKAGVLTNNEAIFLAVKETLRYGLFLGTFAGTFVSVDEIVGEFGGHRRTAKWRALLAGAIAGPSILLTGLNTQHNSLDIYILMRAAVLAARCGIKSKRFGRICKPLSWAHGDIFLMCLSSSQILSAYILKQESLPPSYKSFLNKHGGKDTIILQGVKEIATGEPFSNLKAIEKFNKTNGVELNLDPEMKVPCSACYYIGMWTCLLFRIFKKCNIPMVAMGTFPTGLALAIEKKSRRLEISLYCLARAIESFFTCMADVGYIPQSKKLKRVDVLVFSLSTAIIMHCYAQEREVFRSKYLNVLDWVFGVPPPPCETPRCKDMLEPEP